MLQGSSRLGIEPSRPGDQVFSEAISFLLSRRGAVDVLTVFDGDQRKARRRLTASFEEPPTQPKSPSDLVEHIGEGEYVICEL